MKQQTEETIVKGHVKEYLAIKGIFNYPLVQGLGAYRGVPDRVMHYKGQVHYLEIKKPDGKLSVYQQMFQGQCHVDDIPYHVIRSLEDIQLVIEEG